MGMALIYLEFVCIQGDGDGHNGDDGPNIVSNIDSLQLWVV